MQPAPRYVGSFTANGSARSQKQSGFTTVESRRTLSIPREITLDINFD
jgi:hypothetical protein